MSQLISPGAAPPSLAAPPPSSSAAPAPRRNTLLLFAIPHGLRSVCTPEKTCPFSRTATAKQQPPEQFCKEFIRAEAHVDFG